MNIDKKLSRHAWLSYKRFAGELDEEEHKEYGKLCKKIRAEFAKQQERIEELRHRFLHGECLMCRHGLLEDYEEPCVSCRNYNKWEPME